ncbi:uncharacterized protein HMPREF1541_01962 [Cyphellophora europaea CBS 101466]|uniref:Ig-like domain-containing protein n=1 Tax=Cyphellophora europaea (strain CBS 101466) TaxID=1220924 RepID=W2S4A8_CYPE1|nr:uncharacterized protein HMPREF1541_01962 [Cyphellophora europaea CBS 101466]ETN42804.1 hypothetical protein HMPREF1541_01962 [Cyphellophora europaea CBS 101466]
MVALVALLVHHALSASNVQTFPSTNCEPGTSLSVYNSDAAGSEDQDCKTAPEGTTAIWVETLDEGCTVRTFSSPSCSDNLGLGIIPNTCYFRNPSPDPVIIGSWRIVCVAQESQSSAPLSSDATGTYDAAASVAVDATLAPTLTNATTSSTAETTTTPMSQNITTIVPSGSGGLVSNSTGPATWNNTLTPTVSRTSLEVSTVTATASSDDGGIGVTGGGTTGGAVSGGGSGGSARGRGEVEATMLVVSSLLGLGWGALWW